MGSERDQIPVPTLSTAWTHDFFLPPCVNQVTEPMPSTGVHWGAGSQAACRQCGPILCVAASRQDCHMAAGHSLAPPPSQEGLPFRLRTKTNRTFQAGSSLDSGMESYQAVKGEGKAKETLGFASSWEERLDFHEQGTSPRPTDCTTGVLVASGRCPRQTPRPPPSETTSLPHEMLVKTWDLDL